MKHLVYVLPIVAILILMALAGYGSNKIEVVNSGTNVVEVKAEDAEKVLLGQNGSAYFYRGTRFEIGDAAIRFGRRIEIENTGTDEIKIAYRDATGTNRTMLLGENGTGYLDNSIPFKIGDVSIGLSREK